MVDDLVALAVVVFVSCSQSAFVCDDHWVLDHYRVTAHVAEVAPSECPKTKCEYLLEQKPKLDIFALGRSWVPSVPNYFADTIMIKRVRKTYYQKLIDPHMIEITSAVICPIVRSTTPSHPSHSPLNIGVAKKLVPPRQAVKSEAPMMKIDPSETAFKGGKYKYPL